MWIMDGLIYNCNVGDSRFILSCNGRAVPVSEDHKATLDREARRIESNGGFLSDKRVNGILAISRSFGDGYLKNQPGGPTKQHVWAIPDISIVIIDKNIDFMVIASDGVFDMLGNQEVVDIIYAEMEKLTPLSEICQEIVSHCMFPCNPESGIGPDNTTCLIAFLNH